MNLSDYVLYFLEKKKVNKDIFKAIFRINIMLSLETNRINNEPIKGNIIKISNIYFNITIQ